MHIGIKNCIWPVVSKTIIATDHECVHAAAIAALPTAANIPGAVEDPKYFANSPNSLPRVAPSTHIGTKNPKGALTVNPNTQIKNFTTENKISEGTALLDLHSPGIFHTSSKSPFENSLFIKSRSGMTPQGIQKLQLAVIPTIHKAQKYLKLGHCAVCSFL